MVADAMAQMRRDDLQPAEARLLDVNLTALIGNIATELREAEIAYKLVLLDAYQREGKANRAKLVAETSQEYARMRVAKDTAQFTQEAVRSLRSFTRSVSEEMRLSR